MTSPTAVVRAAAKRLRVRVGHCNLHDPNVGGSPPDWKALLENPEPPDRFTVQLRATCEGERITVRASQVLIAVEVEQALSIAHPFSVGRADRIVLSGPRGQVLSGLGRRVFSERRDAALRRADVSSAISEMALGEQESLHVYRNGITIYSDCDNTDRLFELVRHGIALVHMLQGVPEQPSDFSEVPASLQQLVRLVRRWARTDDEARMTLLRKASTAELRELVVQVEPLFDEINRYLDGFGDRPLSSAAIDLGALAEAAAEAKLVLAKRRRR
jgi:hypothetical protein